MIVNEQPRSGSVCRSMSFNVYDMIPTIGYQINKLHICRGAPPWSSLITFGGRSAHLAYLVHKSGRKTSIIITSIYVAALHFMIPIFSFQYMPSQVKLHNVSDFGNFLSAILYQFLSKRKYVKIVLFSNKNIRYLYSALYNL